MKCGGALALSVLMAVGCAGESFDVDDGAAAAGGSEFPQLEVTSAGSGGAGGAAEANAGAAGTPGAGGAAGSEASGAGAAGTSSAAGAGGAAGTAGAAGAAGAAGGPSACGELRNTAGQYDLEVCVPAGTFTMGDSMVATPNVGDYVAHGPAHEVTLPNYVLDAYEVTVARYRACVTAGTCTLPASSGGQGCTYTTDAGSRELFPVTCVSWDQAYQFCAWDGNRRLPSEAEWERAARSTDARRYAWGNDQACVKAVWGGAQCPEYAGLYPRSVGSTPTGISAEGAFDLTGNAWEWVADWFGPYSSAEVTNPTGPDSGSLRILRGGNWQTIPAQSAAFMRRSGAPGAGVPTLSFRCARNAVAPPP